MYAVRHESECGCFYTSVKIQESGTAMTDAGTPCPARGSIGTEAAQYWTDNPDQIPDGSKYKVELCSTSPSRTRTKRS